MVRVQSGVAVDMIGCRRANFVPGTRSHPSEATKNSALIAVSEALLRFDDFMQRPST
jgi:hypothetical protein